MKTCTKCREEKPLDAFGKQKSGPQGLRSRCKDCKRADDGHKKKAKTLAELFWRKVIATGTHTCWAQHKEGTGPAAYGSLTWQKEAIRLHRVSWILHYGAIPPGMHVLHHCDNPPCTNPAHLFLGTHVQNIFDMRSKGRNKGTWAVHFPGGVLHPRHNRHLSDEQVLAIRAAEGTASQAAIARMFGVSKSAVAFIHQGRTWQHLGNPQGGAPTTI